MGWWENWVVPRITEVACGSRELRPWRERTCAGLHGRVLELGFGSGHNTGLYPAAVTSVSAVEPSDVGWELSAQRRARSKIPIERTGLDGQALTSADAAFDSALSTFTLCTIPDAVAALREVRRVLVPGGTIHFLEHGLAPDDGVARWQRRLEPAQRAFSGGCHLTRDIPDLLAAAGFEVLDLAEQYLPGPKAARPWSYGYLGRAVAAGSAPR
ncbi:class I SAM-dependent methyltransferase [Nocardioides speluncae]|uniref:class I SAM-dependent methyltransferase n=1 Tax=Nocardioides speluncae TaxID=2670337 RepID=UPI000D688612|nr:class I SAM-dependent methyltransferase [Nocardioides speluncae]